MLINLVIAYNDDFLFNSRMIGNYFPVIAFVLTIFFVLAVNTAAKKWFRSGGLSPGEILLVWSMIGISGGICGAGIMRYFPSWVAVPGYYATPTNEWGEYILKYLPDWMLLSRDPDNPAVRWLMEGLPEGKTIPWGFWIVPMIAWFSFIIFLYAANFSLVSFFYHQWSVRERLIFPVVKVLQVITESPAKGSLVNSFFRNRLTWLGCAIPCLIWGYNGLGTYVPGLPRIPMTWYVWDIFPDRPWSEFHPEYFHIYFTFIGMTFLLTTQNAFSFWFFFIAYKLSFVFIAWLGAAATGYWSNWTESVSVFDSAGATLVIAGFLFFTARGFLREWWGRLKRGVCDYELDPIAPRLAFALFLIGAGGMIGWFLLAGAQWWAALIAVILFLAILLVMTRLLAETGLIYLLINVVPFDFLTSMLPRTWFSGSTIASLTMQKGMIMNDLGESFMPYLGSAARAVGQIRMHLGKAMAVFALTALVALGTAAYGRIVTTYKYGGINMDPWGNVQSPQQFLGDAAVYQKNPPTYEYLKIADIKIVPVYFSHLLSGAFLALAMLALRARFLWWPLHPFGLIICSSWAMSLIWFSIFLGWLAKSLVMTFGGAPVYRRLLPFFLGLIMGESLICAFWAIIGMVTGTPGSFILPN